MIDALLEEFKPTNETNLIRKNSLLRRQQAIDDARDKARIVDITKLQHPNASLFPLGFQTVEAEAANCDEAVIEATRECDEVGQTLIIEVARVRAIRIRAWEMSIKVMASNWKEYFTEEAAIWEGVLKQFDDPSSQNASFYVSPLNQPEVKLSTSNSSDSCNPIFPASPHNSNKLIRQRQDIMQDLLGKHTISSNIEHSNGHEQSQKQNKDSRAPTQSALLGDLLGGQNTSNIDITENDCSEPLIGFLNNTVPFRPSTATTNTPQPSNQHVTKIRQTSSYLGELLAFDANADNASSQLQSSLFSENPSNTENNPEQPSSLFGEEANNIESNSQLPSSLFGD